MSSDSPVAPPDAPTLAPGEAWRVGVVVETPQHSGLVGVLDYLSAQPLVAGSIVRVPLGRRTVTGVVWRGEADLEDAGPPGAPWDASALKTVAEVLDGLPPLPQVWRQLVGFASAYYQRSIGEMALMVLPPELRQLDAVQWARRVKRLDKALASQEGEAGATAVAPQGASPRA
jgi:primosomal protein N' (replication factor Y)